MKNFIIILENNPKSEYFGKIAIESGKKFGWNIERFNGIDGRTIDVDNIQKKFQLKINLENKKCIRLFKKPGVRGCFLSHWLLWNKCLILNEPIGIFEDDIIFEKNPLFDLSFMDILKLDKLKQGKTYAAGNWWEGAHAYVLTPIGAKKLIDWSYKNGILPADMMLGTNILKVIFNEDQLVKLNPEGQMNLDIQSLTKNL